MSKAFVEEFASGVFPISAVGGVEITENTCEEPANNATAARPASMQGVVGNSAALTRVFELIDRIAPSLCTVLITGESGTGKELVANAIHRSSRRAHGPMVVVNCGAIPEALLESELFGHAKGAFTGAHVAKQGRIAMAQGGTLFLDEVGELPLSLQVKLLRLLQQHEYSPVGDTRTFRADVRIVAATNVDLEQAVAQGLFRKDLYYRLNVIHLRVPALRDRPEDVPALVEHFLTTSVSRTGRPGMRISPRAVQMLQAWSWPGNVRELENAIERATILAPGDTIDVEDLPANIRGVSTVRTDAALLPDGGVDLRRAVESYENDLIRQALERTAWNKNRAARLLGLNRTTLVEMLKRKRIAARAA